MGSFNDLPKDVMWLIFKDVIHQFAFAIYGFRISSRTVFQVNKDSEGRELMRDQLILIACINRLSFTIVRSKLTRQRSNNRRFFFKKNVLD